MAGIENPTLLLFDGTPQVKKAQLYIYSKLINYIILSSGVEEMERKKKRNPYQHWFQGSMTRLENDRGHDFELICSDYYCSTLQQNSTACLTCRENLDLSVRRELRSMHAFVLSPPLHRQSQTTTFSQIFSNNSVFTNLFHLIFQQRKLFTNISLTVSLFQPFNFQKNIRWILVGPSYDQSYQMAQWPTSNKQPILLRCLLKYPVPCTTANPLIYLHNNVQFD